MFLHVSRECPINWSSPKTIGTAIGSQYVRKNCPPFFFSYGSFFFFDVTSGVGVGFP